jgi:phosphoenolpyruvate carboxykinase (ATP)
MITAALEGRLDTVDFTPHPVFGISMPKTCPGVPSELLNPRDTWSDKTAYDEMAASLAGWFVSNFEKYAGGVSAEILSASPVIH